MKPIDIAIIVVVAALFAAALGYIIYRKLKHKGGCDCGDCASCGACDKRRGKNHENVGCCRCGTKNDADKSDGQSELL